MPKGRRANEGLPTGRNVPKNLNEQLAIKEVVSNPAGGEQLTNITLGDPRWTPNAGWVKMQQKVNGSVIHYVYNKVTGAVADFKFVN